MNINKMDSISEAIETMKATGAVIVSLLEHGGKEGKAVAGIFRKSIFEQIKKHKCFAGKNITIKEYLSDEIEGIANLCLAEHYNELKEWLKNPTSQTVPLLSRLIDEKAAQLAITIKDVNRNYIGERTKKRCDKEEIDLANQYDIDESPAKTSASYDDEMLENEAIDRTPPTRDDRNTREVVLQIKAQLYAWDKFFDNIQANGGKKISALVREGRELIKTIIKENITKSRDDIIAARSVYSLSKEKNVDYRELLNTLRSIGFPMLDSESGRYSNMIRGKHIALFERAFTSIQHMWKREENYKGWIALFKDKKGWEKSRISKFMKRCIEDKTVSHYFFYIVPPDPDSPLVNRVVSKDSKIISFCKDLENLFPVDPKNVSTHNELKLELISMVKESTKTLLTS